MNELSQAWTDYLAVLQEHAPATRASILPPGELDLESAQQVLRSPLLPSTVTWFGLHGGTTPEYNGSPLPRCLPLSLDEAVDNTEMIRDIWQLTFDLDLDPPETGTAGDVMGTWLDEYVLIAANGSGGGLFVDQRPGSFQGCVRYWDKVDADEDPVVSPSLQQFLVEVAASVQDRRPLPLMGAVPVVTDGELDWENAN
ncbi:hypothetical protein GCM10022223_52560 [Kineosporia mesophila]|uniref:Knr4/Smi1-like domain-containing protein n=1 Tax=Kineosporia mesophila TaxID=566012 RepID=A0ABP7ABK5_9ACTN|nr:SMI1/KNR4 family protein [Kineosporia mesophila]MCD5351359.1 hypothetical protein [Kineosporia mesophila]